PARRSHGALWAVVGVVVAVVLLVLLGALLLAPPQGAAGAAAVGGVPVGTAVLLAVALVAVIGGITVAVLLVRSHQAGRRRAEEARDRAADRAQLLAAAMDPEVAMRLLGYDGRRGPEA
ncbi:ATPase, partial [Microbispora sp. NPDC049633]